MTGNGGWGDHRSELISCQFKAKCISRAANCGEPNISDRQRKRKNHQNHSLVLTNVNRTENHRLRHVEIRTLIRMNAAKRVPGVGVFADFH